MPLDHPTLETLRRQHPAWRLLVAEHARLVASFLHRVFITPNVRVMARADLAEALEDDLFGLRQQLSTVCTKVCGARASDAVQASA